MKTPYQETFIYVIARKNADGFTSPSKIGITGKIDTRLSQIRTACPFPVEVFCKFSLPRRQNAIEIERAFHCTQSDKRLHGEWFDIEPRTAAGIVTLGIGVFLTDVIGLDTAQCNEVWPRINIDGEA